MLTRVLPSGEFYAIGLNHSQVQLYLDDGARVVPLTYSADSQERWPIEISYAEQTGLLALENSEGLAIYDLTPHLPAHYLQP